MTIATTGVTNPNTLVARQEIRTFANDRELMELYLQGLQRFQAVDQQDPLSWFQIAGIHGRPYIPYDGAGQRSATRFFGGYCAHSSILFPPWHRPYLALFEQTLAKHVTDIANSYPAADKAKYVSAAQRFRVPYWDWAANADLPDFISIQKEVTVNTPTGRKTFPNPLFSYTFHPMYSNFGDGLEEEATWESWQSTLRYPTTEDPSARTDSSELEATLQNNRLTIRDRTYNLLTRFTDYGPFSNDQYPGRRTDPGLFDSLESIHGSLHGLTGSNGHMGIVDYAAFDPVFWLHHCNVDRIFALWQALNPTSYVTSQANSRGNFATRPGTVETADSPLAPFRKTNGQFWTSSEVRDTRTFNYTYPELVNWAQLSPQQKGSRIRTDINAVYGRSAPIAAIKPELFKAAAARASVPVASSSRPVAAAAQQVLQAPAAAASSAVKAVTSTATKAVKVVAGQPQEPGRKSAEFTDFSAADDPVLHDGKHYLEWIANITVEKYAAKSTFSVHIFLGDFNPDPAEWRKDPNLVGSHVVFANNLGFTGCERCQEAASQHKLVTGTIPLTGALGDRLGKDKLNSLTPAQIAPYLQKELHWRIQRHDGTVIEREDIPSLKVSVAHFVVSIPDSPDQFPTWGEGHRDASVTAGRLGGAGDDDD